MIAATGADNLSAGGGAAVPVRLRVSCEHAALVLRMGHHRRRVGQEQGHTMMTRATGSSGCSVVWFVGSL